MNSIAMEVPNNEYRRASALVTAYLGEVTSVCGGPTPGHTTLAFDTELTLKESREWLWGNGSAGWKVELN